MEGHSRAGSDLDVGVKFSDALTSGERFRKRCRLSGRLQSDEAPFVDVSDLDSLPPDVARAAVKGELLCGDDDDRREFDERIEALAEDAQSAERHRDVIRRVAEEGLRG
ncbi:DNA polymerase subunit beta [Halobacteriales archaeon SW_7_65_23]|nr:MAG: DNA polymerase subunit beta [Halobacteriales archaeon SW_7_65_23]